MKKKLILVIAIVLIVIVGAGTGVATYAVWDSKKEDLSVGFNTGSDYRITVNMDKLDQSASIKNFRPNGPLSNKNSADEIIVRKFTLTLKEYESVTHTVGNIEMKETNKDEVTIANEFMAVKIYEGDTIAADKEIAVGAALKANTTYILTFKFIVNSDSELLSVNMQNAKISTLITFTGQSAPAQGGNA